MRSFGFLHLGRWFQLLRMSDGHKHGPTVTAEIAAYWMSRNWSQKSPDKRSWFSKPAPEACTPQESPMPSWSPLE